MIINEELLQTTSQHKPDGLILELNQNDPRFSENKGVELKDAKLGQLGQILDVVWNPKRNESDNAHCVYLECEDSEIISDTKQFDWYKTNIIKYILSKEKKYTKEELTVKIKNIDGVEKSYRVGDEKSFEIIYIGPDKKERVPVRLYCGMKKGNNKFIIQTHEDYGYFAIKFFYKKGDEKVIDQFIEYLEELIIKNNFYKGQKISPKMEFLKLGNTSWADVYLEPDIKEKITYNIIEFFEKEEIYKKNGISSKCGLIWEGPPGTGKTMAGRALANGLDDITLVWVTPHDVNGANDIKRIYKIATDLKNSLVFFEDADLYCVDRGYNIGSGNNSVLGEIMNQLDGLVPLEGVATIFTTNDPSVLEKAIIDRPGRFDERIEFLPPRASIIVRMIKKFLSIPSYNEEDLIEISEKSEKIKLTGAHIKRLCDLSTIYAIKENSLNKNDIAIIKKEHLDKAFENIKDMKIKAGESKAEYLKGSKIKEDTSLKYPSTGAIPVDCAESKLNKTISIENEKPKSLIRELIERGNN